jgi:co-chaperonin GroES (HSP10)
MDRVLIRLEKTKNKTAGGILLTDEAIPTRTVGVVESVGEDVRSVQIGDKVLFKVFDELPTIEDGLVVVRERSLLGKITN